MSREMSVSQKIKLINKLNKAFEWNIKADKIKIITDRTSGAFKWASVFLEPEIHSELITATKIINAKELSFNVENDIGRTIDIMDEPFMESSYFTYSSKRDDKIEFRYTNIN